MNVYIFEDSIPKADNIVSLFTRLQAQNKLIDFNNLALVHNDGSILDKDTINQWALLNKGPHYFYTLDAVFIEKITHLAENGPALIIIDLALSREETDYAKTRDGIWDYYHAPTAKDIIERFFEINNNHLFLVESAIEDIEEEEYYKKIIWELDPPEGIKINFFDSNFTVSSQASVFTDDDFVNKIERMRGAI